MAILILICALVSKFFKCWLVSQTATIQKPSVILLLITYGFRRKRTDFLNPAVMNGSSLLPSIAVENAVFPSQVYSNCFSFTCQYRHLAHGKPRSLCMRKCSLVFQPRGRKKEKHFKTRRCNNTRQIL